VSGVAVLWGVFLPLAYILAVPVGLGIAGIMLAMGVDENLRALLLYVRWRYLTAERRASTLFDHTISARAPGRAQPSTLELSS
jgi:Na+-driven multidrug efflux pump